MLVLPFISSQLSTNFICFLFFASVFFSLVAQDDSRGVGEPLNETAEGITSYASEDSACQACRLGDGVIVRGTHVLQLRAPGNALAALRPAADRVFAPLLTLVSPIANLASAAEAASAASLGRQRAKQMKQLATDSVDLLPPNIKLLTLQAVNTSAIFLRLEHTFAVDEDPVLSEPVSLNVTSLLLQLGFIPTGATELTLTGNQAREDLHYLEWATTEDPVASSSSKSVRRGGRRLSDDLAFADGMITLNPMEIRTAVFSISAA